MRFSLVLLASLLPTLALADSFWHHNGSEVAMESEGDVRRITYFKPRAGLPVTLGTLLFEGRAQGNQYFGTAYVFSSRCRVALPYSVRGAVSSAQRKITLYGRAPTSLDRNCSPVAYRDDVLEFHFTGCGCECGDEPELAAIYPPRRSYAEGSQPGYSCPNLYGWDHNAGAWLEYGKVIREARGDDRSMTEVIQLKGLHLRFRLAEEEPEEAFIQATKLAITLKDGREFNLSPTYQGILSRSKKRIHVPAFGRIEFSFNLPTGVFPHEVERAALAITGFYRDLPFCALPRNPSSK